MAYHNVLQDQITLEELNVLDKLPHYCPVCAYHEWNLDGAEPYVSVAGAGADITNAPACHVRSS